MASQQQTLSATDTSSGPTVPSITLPKGGGAIRGIGEKFGANPVTGTGSMTVPITTSPGRSGFGPQLALSYDSGSGNGPFGFGWSLALPTITRKTDKGLPRYQDDEESDVFILSGSEDLVPAFRTDPAGTLELHDGEPIIDEIERVLDGVIYRVRRYRPRVEGLFARIERWTNDTDRQVHWRTLSKDNVLTIYGRSQDSQIADPADPSRVFSWLICETRDDRGNGIVYDYKGEDGTGVDFAAAHERNRGARDDPRRRVNRYLKRVRYGNRATLLDASGQRPPMLGPDAAANADWMFEVVFDYGEHDAVAPKPSEAGGWTSRPDSFSTYRAGFEVRTTRLCQRVLMFHHFEHEAGVGVDCLVRSTDFEYSAEQHPASPQSQIYSFLQSVTQAGYRRTDVGYHRRALPSIDFEYSPAVVQGDVAAVHPASLENLPIGLDGTTYQWIDLHGEGTNGILTEQAGAWFYKRNLSPASARSIEFAPTELVATKPQVTLTGGRAQIMDLAGDGLPDVVMLDGAAPGFYEHDEAEGWESFRSFAHRLNRDPHDPNLKFVDLNGDGHADVLITEGDTLVWHPSLGEAGFGPARQVPVAFDDEQGPRVVFADGTESVFLADCSGDGLTDLVRIRNGDICYWPNLGYGRFGAKVTMDHAPWFDRPDQFDPKRIRLADIDGSGTTDIVYLSADGPRLYFNQSGNSWSEPEPLRNVPRIDDVVSVAVLDLLGNGTACLVWSSPGDSGRSMWYVNLVGELKPHLLVKSVNNLGAETRVSYAPSTKFYLHDKAVGKPWLTRLPFPVHVVERVETYDYTSRTRFVTRYAYHHGYFDGAEREFRGFAMVEQWDTEEFESIGNVDGHDHDLDGSNWDSTSDVPPTLTRTWFHTGALVDGASLVTALERDYYREDGVSLGLEGPSEEATSALLVDDVVLTDHASDPDVVADAHRALRGSVLRLEVYAEDGSALSDRPYVVTERGYRVDLLQPRADNPHPVVRLVPWESITLHYDRAVHSIGGQVVADPRVGHEIVLSTNSFGQVRESAVIAYGRRHDDPDPLLSDVDRLAQKRTFVSYSVNDYTNTIDTTTSWRLPLVWQNRSFELINIPLPDAGPGGIVRCKRATLRSAVDEASDGEHDVPHENPFPSIPAMLGPHRRLTSHVVHKFSADDLGSPLDWEVLGPLALPLESYRLAYTAGLISKLFEGAEPGLDMAPNLTEAGFVQLADIGDALGESRDGWWIPSGRVGYSPGADDDPVAELAWARDHFFIPFRYADAFGNTTSMTYDAACLVPTSVQDALGNTTRSTYNYRVMQVSSVTDPNGNVGTVAHDALGLVVASAIAGKAGEAVGDVLDATFDPDLDEAVVRSLFADPIGSGVSVMQGATSRTVYDLHAYERSVAAGAARRAPTAVLVLAREMHSRGPGAVLAPRLQISLSFADGAGRELQRKSRAEAGPLEIGGPNVTRWVGSGWLVLNNKGKPIREYEPFFTATHDFEFGRRDGVSPTLFYDPIERVVARLEPDHAWTKTVFDPWHQVVWDQSDTVLSDPADDPDVGGYFTRLSADDYLPSWHARRIIAADLDERAAAAQSAGYAATPSHAFADALGRPVVTVAHNQYVRDGVLTTEIQTSRVTIDISGNQHEVIDAAGRMIARFGYDLLGHRCREDSMDAGTHWVLADVAGRPVLSWDNMGRRTHSTYDALRRPSEQRLIDGSAAQVVVSRTTYGEQVADATQRNLRGRVSEIHDTAGVLTHVSYDFKGHLERTERRFAVDYRSAPDWSTQVALEVETHVASSTIDALERPIEIRLPDASVLRPVYNEASLLERIEGEASGGATTVFVSAIGYDAKGRRTSVHFATGDVRTSAVFDRDTSRLVRTRAERGAGDVIQDLTYHYDVAGNVVRIHDSVQQTAFFDNSMVEPHRRYVYDACFRLIQADGREHRGQVGGSLTAPGPGADPGARIAHPADGAAVNGYREYYDYDVAGNIRSLTHIATTPGVTGWTRLYDYVEASALEPTKMSDRLSTTSVGAAPAEHYRHDSVGSMIGVPHLSVVRWNARHQLTATATQVVNAGTPETTFYVYDNAGTRVRKVTESAAAAGQTPRRMRERLYFGGAELFRRYQADGTAVALERRTLHVSDGATVFALVETRVTGSDDGLEQLTRYQVTDLLASVHLEVDPAGSLITYEEYHPYGSTSYQGVRNQLDTPKRYRFTSRERDEETGWYHHGARYYAPWLGRWTSADPIGIAAGTNRYRYCRNRPTGLVDPSGTQECTVSASVCDPKYYKSPQSRWDELKKTLAAISDYAEKDPGPALVMADSVASLYVRQDLGYGRGFVYTIDKKGLGEAGVSASDIEAMDKVFTDTGYKPQDQQRNDYVTDVGDGWTVLKSMTPAEADKAERGLRIAHDDAQRAKAREVMWGLLSSLAGVSAGRTQMESVGGSSNRPTIVSAGSRDVTGGPSPSQPASAGGGSPPSGTGAYKDVAGHHVHQSAAYSPAGTTSRKGNPNHRDAISIQQNVPDFTGAQHDRASSVQLNLNRAQNGAVVKTPSIGGLTISAAGNGTTTGTPSPWFEDTKAFFALRAAGFPPSRAYSIVDHSAKQMQQAGVVPVRVPKF